MLLPLVVSKATSTLELLPTASYLAAIAETLVLDPYMLKQSLFA